MGSKIFFGTKPRRVPAEHNMLDHKPPMIAGSAQCFKATRCLFGAEGSRLSIPSRCSCYKWYPKFIWPTSQQTCLEDLRIPVLACSSHVVHHQAHPFDATPGPPELMEDGAAVHRPFQASQARGVGAVQALGGLARGSWSQRWWLVTGMTCLALGCTGTLLSQPSKNHLKTI